MNKLQLEDKLRKMVGKTYMYNQINQKFLRFEIIEDKVRVVTDCKDITFDVSAASEKLNDFLQVSDEKQIAVSNSVTVMLPELLINKKANDLSDIIFKSIELLKADPVANLSKAAAINDQVKSFIELCKTEVDAGKIALMIHKFK